MHRRGFWLTARARCVWQPLKGTIIAVCGGWTVCKPQKSSRNIICFHSQSVGDILTVIIAVADVSEPRPCKVSLAARSTGNTDGGGVCFLYNFLQQNEEKVTGGCGILPDACMIQTSRCDIIERLLASLGVRGSAWQVLQGGGREWVGLSCLLLSVEFSSESDNTINKITK